MIRFTDQTEEGQRLIEALSTSPIKKLTELDLRFNPAWFEDQEYALLLADFVSRQVDLSVLDLGYNSLSDEVIEEMKQVIA